MISVSVRPSFRKIVLLRYCQIDQRKMADTDINLPNFIKVLFRKIQIFFLNLSEIEIAILSSIGFFIIVLLICLLVLIIECIVRCRTREPKPISAEKYFKRSLRMSEKMSKINTPEFKHFEIELRRDSGTSSMSGSRESGLDSCFIDKCNHKDKSKSGVDSLAEGGVLV